MPRDVALVTSPRMKRSLLLLVPALLALGAFAALRESPPEAPPLPPPPLTAADGPRLYGQFGCLNCHGPTGRGQFDLTRHREHLPSDEQLAAFIRNPRAAKPDCVMPPYERVLREDELQVLVGFVRALGPDAGAP